MSIIYFYTEFIICVVEEINHKGIKMNPNKKISIRILYKAQKMGLSSKENAEIYFALFSSLPT